MASCLRPARALVATSHRALVARTTGMQLSAKPPHEPQPRPLSSAHLDRISLIATLAVMVLLAVAAEAPLLGALGLLFVVLVHQARKRSTAAELDRAKYDGAGVAYEQAERLAKQLIAQRRGDADQQAN